MTEHHDRIVALAERARADREAFDPPDEPPDEAAALDYLRDGVGEVVSVYVAGRTGEFARFSEREMTLMDRALNDWLECYARCYGTDIDAEFAVREVAELIVETHDVHDAAKLLTHVPDPEVRRARG